ncbi:MAG: tryptophan synthase subunit alpha [Actinobacteria bacterium RBG_16_64_13]|nr:MAG: tryptophan synthase subunit alpha [Actinobacteria bacterium RBG_16_64_13]
MSTSTGSALTGIFREAGHPLLMPYAVGGYPDLASCREIIRTYVKNGAQLVELGIPFSDPLADGPVIQAASQVALRQGVRPADVLDLAGTASQEGAGVVLLSYLNTILAFGGERFFHRCRDRGVLGVVVPDVPVEEAAELQAIARAHGVDVILLAAPTSTDARLARIAGNASGFIYCVSTTGVTGARTSLRTDLAEFVARVRRHTDLPLVVGFGVSTAEQAAEVAGYADGVIIGSALVDLVARSKRFDEALAEIGRLLYRVRSMPSFSR